MNLYFTKSLHSYIDVTDLNKFLQAFKFVFDHEFLLTFEVDTPIYEFVHD